MKAIYAFARSAIALLLAGGSFAFATPARADAVRNAEWFIAYLNLTQAHKTSKGAGVIIGLPDTGVFPHQDFRKNLMKGKDTIPGGNGTGQIDRLGHGTEMAGLIAGHGRGASSGMLGIAPSARILPIRSLGAMNEGVGIDRGIVAAVDLGAKVVNVSAGTAPSISLTQAIKRAEEADALIVASAGNTSTTRTVGPPANASGVLAVGAIGRNGEHLTTSTRGSAIQICAPGDDIVTTAIDNKYRKVSGTSSAAAIVSGAAALVRAKFPDLSAQEVSHRLTATATDIGPPGRDDQCGYGVLNIVKALTADVPPLGAGSTAPTSAAASPAPSTSAASSPIAGPSADAGGSSDSEGVSGTMIAGGAAALVALGGLVAFLALRGRRRSPSAY